MVYSTRQLFQVLIHAGQAAESGSTPLIKGYRSYLWYVMKAYSGKELLEAKQLTRKNAGRLVLFQPSRVQPGESPGQNRLGRGCGLWPGFPPALRWIRPANCPGAC